MNDALELLIVRHGETTWNVERRYQGHTDVPISEVGVAQARALAQRLAPLRARNPLVFSSDLMRARQTAELACDWATPQLDARLRELAFGEFEGFTYDENVARFGAQFSNWITRPVEWAPAGGESIAMLHTRLDAWLADLPKSGCVIAFTHGGVVRALVSRATGNLFDPEIPVPPTAAVWLRFDGESRVPAVEWLT